MKREDLNDYENDFEETEDMESKEDTDFEDYDDTDEYDESEDYDDEQEPVELAPSSILGYIRFMRDKNNKKDTFATLPKSIKSKITRHLLLIAIILALGIATLIVSKTTAMLLVSAIIAAIMGVLAFRLYLIGTRRQYVQFQGIVVRSDYTKNVIEKAKNSLTKTVNADFRYNSFVVKTDDEYVRVNCNKTKELPQEGDAVRITIPGSSKVYEEEGLTTITTYIDIERIA